MKDHVTFMGSHKNVGLTIIDFKRSIMPHDSADAPIPMEGPCQVRILHTAVHCYLINNPRDVQSWNRRFGRETIHPTKKITSMNLLQMSCMMTWA